MRSSLRGRCGGTTVSGGDTSTGGGVINTGTTSGGGGIAKDGGTPTGGGTTTGGITAEARMVPVVRPTIGPQQATGSAKLFGPTREK